LSGSICSCRAHASRTAWNCSALMALPAGGRQCCLISTLVWF
jgi:hypothetical protein